MAFYKVYNDNNNDNNKGPFNWFLVLFMFLIGAWPIALMLFFGNLAPILADRMNRAKSIRKDRNGYRGTYTQGQIDFSDPDSTNDPQTQEEKEETFRQERARSLKTHKILSSVFLILGACIAAVSFPACMRILEDISYNMFDSYTIRYSVLPALYSLVGGGAFAWVGSRMKRTLRLEKLMATITGDADNISIKKLSSSSGYNKKETLDLVKSAINHGLFGSSAYIDMSTDTLVIRGEAPAPAPKKPRKKKEETVKEEPKPENTYTKILQQLRSVNDAIPGEEMSAKIDRLEDISTRIFTLVEKAPEKKPQMSKFMDYYLPTALKLLDTYATLDQQGLQGQNVTETKSSIENAMDMLIDAFEGQLDKLFQTDALDVSSDIAALQNMLTMDGLTPDGLFSSAAQPSDPN